MKVFLDSVGCRLNQAEIERYARQFQAAGHTLVAVPQEADLALVNTCAVTTAAVSDFRGRKFARSIVWVRHKCWSPAVGPPCSLKRLGRWPASGALYPMLTKITWLQTG